MSIHHNNHGRNAQLAPTTTIKHFFHSFALPSLERRYDAAAGVGKRGGREVLVDLEVGIGSLGEPSLDPRPGLGVGLPRRVPDGLLEPPRLPLLPVPVHPGLPVHGHELGRHVRRRGASHREEVDGALAGPQVGAGDVWRSAVRDGAVVQR